MQNGNNSSSVFKERFYFSDGRIETTLMFQKHIPLIHLAAFELLRNEEGRKILESYYKPYLTMAAKYRLGFVMNSPTWRASCDWGFKLGYTHDELFALNKQSIKFIRELARNFPSPHVVISGTIGPRAADYKRESRMTAEQSKVYHLEQVKAYAMADADLVTALNIAYSDEAIGIISAAKSFGMPVVISFTVGMDGILPGGESLKDAIEKTDSTTDLYAECFMKNCTIPKNSDWNNKSWMKRINGFRPGIEQLQSKGDELFQQVPGYGMVGGCCGVTYEHIDEVCRKISTISIEL